MLCIRWEGTLCMLEYNKIEKLLLSGIWSYFKNQTWYSENGGHFVFLVLGWGTWSGYSSHLLKKRIWIVDENFIWTACSNNKN